MDFYDPLEAPDSKEWLELDEQERIEMVSEYHEAERFDLPNAELHATIHVMIENQVALGDETPVAATLERLLREGLDRHNAIHAIGTVLTGHIWDILHGEDAEPSDDYYAGLEQLSAHEWLRGG